MKVRLSLHTRRRAKLYNIPEDTIIEILKGANPASGKNEILAKVDNFNFPLKIVFDYLDDEFFVITNYPLKKGKKNENSL